jgi:hypothetical protein
VTVKVNKEVEALLMFGFEVFDKLEQVESLRKCKLSGLVKSAVKVLTKEARPIVTHNYTIRVDHRHDIGNKVLPELFGLGLVTANILQKTLTNERTIGLSRMYTPSNHNNFFIVRLCLFISYFQHWNRQSSETF